MQNKGKNFFEDKPKILLAAVLLLITIFLSLTAALYLDGLHKFDTVLGEYIRSFASPTLTNVVIAITHVGSAQVDILVFVVLGWYLYFVRGEKLDTAALAICLAGSWLLNTGLKALFYRPRPDLHHLVEVSSYSYPSGHAMISAAFYGMVGYLLWRNARKNLKWSWAILLIFGMLATAIGLSRVYLGVHYPSDVIAGFAAGGLWLAACIIWLRRVSH